MAYISLVMANKIMSIRMSIHTSVHMLHMPTCAHTCAYTHAYTYVCMHACMHFYTHVGTQVYTYVHTHAYTHVCTHVCTCMSIHMSIYTYLSPSRPLVFMRPNACPHAMPARMPRKISGTRLRTHVCTCTCRGMFMCMSVHMAAHTCRGAWPMPPSPPRTGTDEGTRECLRATSAGMARCSETMGGRRACVCGSRKGKKTSSCGSPARTRCLATTCAGEADRHEPTLGENWRGRTQRSRGAMCATQRCCRRRNTADTDA